MCKVYELKFQKFIRGQVWFLTEEPDVTKVLRDHGSNVTNGSRPYFIIGQNGGHVTCMPMTTNVQRECHTEYDVVFTTTDTQSRIMVSQICTKSVDDFSKYLYTFDKESIDIVMASVAKFLGISVTASSEKEEVKNKIDLTALYQQEKRPATQEERNLMDEFKDRIKRREPGCKKPIFQSVDEAKVFLKLYGDMPLQAVTGVFGGTTMRCYHWIRTAKWMVGEK